MRGNDDDWGEGRCRGETVHMDSDEHHSILGPDGEPLRYIRRRPIGFDLTPRKRRAASRQATGKGQEI